MGNFTKEFHNNDIRERLTDEITKISQEKSLSISTIDSIAKSAVGDKEITNRARIVINALMDACRKMRNVTQQIDANRYKELEKQADDYNNGRSKYIKGKGWQ